MDFSTIDDLQKNDPTISALRKEWIPLAISFFHRVFKQNHKVSVAQDVFREQLELYIERLNTSLPEDRQYRGDPDYYIDRWSREDDMLRIRSREDEYVIQLSPYAERLIGWFEGLQRQGTIGTETRLRTILTLLDDITQRSTEDVEARLNMLYEKRRQLDAEIQHIEQTQEVEGLSDLQIRERLDQITDMASGLLRDFGSLEERFRDLARYIQQEQLNPERRRGDIIGGALKVDEELESSDEGRSFNAFYRLLTQPDEQQGFDSLIQALFSSPRLMPFTGDNTILRYLKSHLLDAGDRVTHSNQRLAEHLRRVVETNNILESRRIQALARDIKYLVNKIDDDDFNTPYFRVFHAVEGDPNVELPMDRPLFEPPLIIPATERPQSAPNLLDVESLASLYSIFYIDETRLHDNITRLLMSRSEVTLSEVVKSYPIAQGIAEVIAYVQLASREVQHTIETQGGDEVIPVGDSVLSIPRVTFRRASALVEEHVS